jgi:hypothetical protein
MGLQYRESTLSKAECAYGEAHFNADTLNEFIPFVEEEVGRLVHAYMTAQRAGHLAANYCSGSITLICGLSVRWRERVHFLADPPT